MDGSGNEHGLLAPMLQRGKPRLGGTPQEEGKENID
jgi:hypothetical protein